MTSERKEERKNRKEEQKICRQEIKRHLDALFSTTLVRVLQYRQEDFRTCNRSIFDLDFGNF